MDLDWDFVRMDRDVSVSERPLRWGCEGKRMCVVSEYGWVCAVGVRGAGVSEKSGE